jgi:hypothetical protein
MRKSLKLFGERRRIFGECGVQMKKLKGNGKGIRAPGSHFSQFLQV